MITEIIKLATDLAPQDYAVGEALIAEGEFADKVFILTDGMLQVSNGTKKFTMVAPAIVGELGWIDARRSASATVVAVSPVKVLVFTYQDFTKLLQSADKRAVSLTRYIAAEALARVSNEN